MIIDRYRHCNVIIDRYRQGNVMTDTGTVI